MTVKIYEVGGSIRNELLGLEPSDRDFAVLAPDYDTMKAELLSRGATIFQERPQFLNIRAKLPELGAVDFTLARKESFYTDGRHPDSVSPVATIEEDLARRDFTINAMAREIGTKNIIDPFGGRHDLGKKHIQCVGNPIKRMMEDKLRAFRAIRFAVQLSFAMLMTVEDAIDTLAPEDFGAVTPERLQVELTKMFKANSTAAMTWLNQFNHLKLVIRDKGIWFQPTLKAK